LVFNSDTVQGRLVFVAPELLNGKPIVMIVEPNADVKGLKVNLLLNAYDRGTTTPIRRWTDEGLLRYYNKAKSPAILARSGLQLSSMAQARSSSGRIYRDSDLVKYRANQASFSRTNNTPIFYSQLSKAISRSQSNIRQPIGDDLLNAVVDRVFGKLHNNGKSARETVIIVDTFESLPGEIVIYANNDGYNNQDPNDRIRGVTYKGKIYLVQEHIHSELEAEETLLHERIHQVLKGNGKNAYTQALNRLYLKLGSGKGLLEMANKYGYALRFGTTEFMKPSKEQVDGKLEKGIAPVKWGDNDVENTRNLIDTFVSTTENKYPKLAGYSYDFGRNTFVDADGRPVSGERFSEGAKGDVARGARAGEATLRAFILTKSLIQSDSRQESTGILQAVLNGSRALVNNGGLDGLFSNNPQAYLQQPWQSLEKSGFLKDMQYTLQDK